MRSIIIGIVSLSIVVFTGSAVAGPFGLKMGMSVAEVKAIDPAMTELAPGKYKLTHVPKPHSAFESYIVQICPKVGLSWIKAIGKNVSTSSYGIELRATFDELSTKLDKSYGAGSTTDVLLPGSIWDEPDDFMMGLAKKERYLFRQWSQKTGAQLNSNLVAIGLVATALDNNTGYLSLEYAFATSEACDEEIESLEDDNL